MTRGAFENITLVVKDRFLFKRPLSKDVRELGFHQDSGVTATLRPPCFTTHFFLYDLVTTTR